MAGKVDRDDKPDPQGSDLPETWPSYRSVPRSKHGPTDQITGWVSDIDVAMRFKLFDGKPRPVYIEIHDLGPDGIDIDNGLDSIDWTATIAWRILQETLDRQLGPEVVDRMPPGELVEKRREAERDLRVKRRKNGVTPERLAEVLRLYEEHGIEAVVEETGKSRSYAYQLVARAKEELPQ